jgi:hypothetical protein
VTETFFAGFHEQRVDVTDGVVLRVRRGGEGDARGPLNRAVRRPRRRGVRPCRRTEVTCPTLVLWSARDDLDELHVPFLTM